MCSYGAFKEIGVFGVSVPTSSCDNFGSDLVVDSKCEYGDSFADKNQLENEFNTQCKGKQYCIFDLS